MQRTYGAVSAERVTQLKRFLRRNKTGWLFVAPFLILFVVFNLLPVLSAAYGTFNFLQNQRVLRFTALCFWRCFYWRRTVCCANKM